MGKAEALSRLRARFTRAHSPNQIAVKASLAGGTLTIENDVLGSTRGKSDYEWAVKEARQEARVHRVLEPRATSSRCKK